MNFWVWIQSQNGDKRTYPLESSSNTFEYLYLKLMMINQPVSLAGGLVGDSLVHICKNHPFHTPFSLTDEGCPSGAVQNETLQTPTKS